MAGSKTNAFETDLLELIFTNVAIADIGGAGGIVGPGTAGSFYIALFTTDPGETGSAAAECDYTSYTRVAVARSVAGWTVDTPAATRVRNDAAVTFPTSTGGATDVVTHFGICRAATVLTADLIYHGSLDSSISVSSGITPEFAINAITVEED